MAQREIRYGVGDACRLSLWRGAEEDSLAAGAVARRDGLGSLNRGETRGAHFFFLLMEALYNFWAKGGARAQALVPAPGNK